jgi:hypothetical protein
VEVFQVMQIQHLEVETLRAGIPVGRGPVGNFVGRSSELIGA